jgi:long-chain acyl-CoA synthetase
MLDNLGQVLPFAARRFGAKTALICGGRRFSFTELDDLSRRLAGGLASLGVAPGDRVTLYAPNSWEWVVGYYAIARLGGVINPINAMLTSEEVAYIVNDCGATAILASSDKGEALLALKDASPLQEIVLFGDDAPAGTHHLAELLKEQEPARDDFPAAACTLATVGYTSGTTGFPKGAMQTHRAILLSAAMTANVHARTAADTVVTALPSPHVYGTVIMNSAFLCGMTLVLLERFNETAVLEAIQRHRATMFDGVPTMYLYLLNHPSLDTYDLSSLTRCTVGGQTIPVAKAAEIETRFGCPLLEMWGMTELAGVGTAAPLYGWNRHGSIGLPLPYMEGRIADLDDAGRTLGPRQDGELMVRGPLVMLGYYGNEAATRAAIEPDGWLHTGDVAHTDADGYVYIVDRKKDLILTAGYNVYPAELERVIAAHPAVAMVAVGAQKDEIKGELAKAYVVLKRGAVADQTSILAHCREHLAPYKVPRAVQFVDDLPKTSTGKILRRELTTLDR